MGIVYLLGGVIALTVVAVCLGIAYVVGII